MRPHLEPSDQPTPEPTSPLTPDDGDELGMSEDRIAASLGLTRSRVRSIMGHALNKLRRRPDRRCGLIAAIQERGRIAEERMAARAFAELAAKYDVPTARKLLHPAELVGIAKKRQWILDRVPGPVFMVDDDVMRLWSLVGLTGRAVEGPENIRRVIENAAGIAESVGAPVFGFDQSWDVRKFSPYDPLRFTGWIGTAI